MSDRYEVHFTFEDELSSELRGHLVEWMEQTYQHVDGSPSVRNLEVSLDAPGLSCHIQYDGVDEAAVDLPELRCTVEDHHFYPRADESDEEAIDRIGSLYTFLRALYEACAERGATPLYVYGPSPVEVDRATDPNHPNRITRERILAGELPGIWWCQVLPPRLAGQFESDDLLSVPAFRVEELPDGGAFIVVHHAVTTEGTRDHSPKTVAEHLGVDGEF